ncbi:AI-2E family transporter [Corynebacterium frankenforstense]|uniref:AI-2E family transporter n=1 Tax=Corynebacterium frankenforstense TaxID=1230998 RepID=UPI001FE8CC3B|nr:AI-2E family transporter [Corynebacterium frankenforstense]
MSTVDAGSDEVDRSVVMLRALRDAAKVCVQVLVICVTAYGAWFVLGKFWAGIFPVIIALILCTVLASPTGWLRRHHVPGGLAALITLLGFFGVVGAVFAVVAPDVARQSQAMILQAVEGIQRLRLWLQGPPVNLDSEDFDQAINEAVSWIQNQAGTIAGGVFAGISTVTSMAFTLVVVFVLTFFFLKDGHKFLPWVRRVVGRRQGWHLTELLTRAWRSLGGYIRAQAVVSAVDAVCIGVGLYFIGVPMALALAIITFVAGFIPIVGAVSAGALAVLIALVSLGVPQALITLVLIVAVQQLEGNVLSPLLQSKAMNLHPVIVLVSVTVGGGLFNIAGAFLAVPMAAMIAVAFRYTQDIMMLRSGERGLDEINFVTRAGVAVGTVAEEEGQRMRAELHDAVRVAAAGDPDAPVEAAPEGAAAAGRGHLPGFGAGGWFGGADREDSDGAERRSGLARGTAAVGTATAAGARKVAAVFDKLRRR